MTEIIGIKEDMNIILIGMPACGKSVTGVLLAKILNKKFIDGDLLIQQYAGRCLQDIIDNDGLEKFKEIEEIVLKSINEKNAVIATGGSAVYYESAMEHLKANGIAVHIDISLDTVKERLNNIKTRGVAMSKGQTLEELYHIRKPLYEKYADITICSDDDASMEETVEKICLKIKEL